MVRKVFLLLLLVAFWAAVFLPLVSGTPGFLEGLPLVMQPRPSERLPVAWENAQRAVVRASGGAAGGVSAALPEALVLEPSPTVPANTAASSGPCGASYTVQRGDTMGTIAKACGLTLSELLAANPTIQNPNRIYPGQQLSVSRPDSRGGADTLAELVAVPAASGNGFWPGATLEVHAQGLPANTSVRVGMGLTVSGYHTLANAVTDAQGSLTLTLEIPSNARAGEEAFILMTTAGTPSRQVISEVFSIGR